jgi:hypothetical protein
MFTFSSILQFTQRKNISTVHTVPCLWNSRPESLKSHINKHIVRLYFLEVSLLSVPIVIIHFRSNLVLTIIWEFVTEKNWQCVRNHFIHQFLLQKHLPCHLGENPKNCCLCIKNFLENLLLHQHLEVHSGENPYYCDQCRNLFHC